MRPVEKQAASNQGGTSRVCPFEDKAMTGLSIMEVSVWTETSAYCPDLKNIRPKSEIVQLSPATYSFHTLSL